MEPVVDINHDEPRLVDVRELAKILGMKPSWIYQRTRLNRIPFIKLGQYVRFEPDVVIKFFKDKQTTRDET